MVDLSPFFVDLCKSPAFQDALESAVNKAINKDPLPVTDDRCDLDMARSILGSPEKPVSKPFIYRETSKGSLPHKKFGNRLIFSRKEILVWKDARTKDPFYSANGVNDKIVKSAEKKLR